MKRWAWAAAVAAVSALAGMAPGQAPTTPASTPTRAATDGPRDGDVLFIRTSGQSRQVRVLRITRYQDGESLADLQDVTTGAKYTVPGKALAAMAQPDSQAVAMPTPPPPPMSRMPRTGPNGWPAVPVLPPIPQEARRVSAATTPIPTPRPPQAAPAMRVSAAPPKVTASLPAPTLPSVVQPITPIIPPSVIELPPITVPQPAQLPSDPQPAPAEAPPVPTPIQQVRLTEEPIRTDVVEHELKPFLDQLAHALRPSTREWAATAIAESRHGWKREVKLLLFQTAKTDPAPSVRAHCVKLLTKMGYHEPAFVRFLEESLGAESPSVVKQAAYTALERLTTAR